jgi:hypothetical protein
MLYCCTFVPLYIPCQLFLKIVVSAIIIIIISENLYLFCYILLLPSKKSSQEKKKRAAKAAAGKQTQIIQIWEALTVIRKINIGGSFTKLQICICWNTGSNNFRLSQDSASAVFYYMWHGLSERET